MTQDETKKINNSLDADMNQQQYPFHTQGDPMAPNMNLYQATVPQFKKMLFNLKNLLEKAQAHADQRKYDSQILMNARLYPDMFPLMRQIQIACDAAKFAVARLSGQTPPTHEDCETTLKEAQERIEKVIQYLNTFKESDFSNWTDKQVTVGWMKDKYLKSDDYMIQMVIPNFYFHVTTAYALLRMNGIEIGKENFLGELPWKSL